MLGEAMRLALPVSSTDTLGIGRYRLDQDCRFEAVDQQASVMLGLSPTASVGRCIWDLVPTLKDSDLQRRCAAILRGAGTQQFLFHHALMDRWYAVIVEPVGLPARPHALDIRFGEMSASVSATIASERLDAAAQATGRLAHDFNNVLTVIFGNAEYLAELVADRPELANLVHRIIRASEIATTLTGRIQQFDRQHHTSAARAELGGLLGKVAARLAVAAPLWPIEVVAARGLPDVQADPSELEAALLELVTNARDAMPDGGVIQLGATMAACNARVLVTVADRGIGMDTALLQRCREPFVSTLQDAARKGLGLSAVHGFATASGGSLTLQPRLGGGILATLDLAAAAPAAPAAAKAFGHILIVDDDAANRVALGEMVAAFGYSVASAASADEALEMLRRGPLPTLLLSDVILPGGLDGGSLVKAARSLSPTLPALLMSGYAARALQGAESREGCPRLLTKPFRRADLERALREEIAPTRGATLQ